MAYCAVWGINPEQRCLFSRLLKDPVINYTEMLISGIIQYINVPNAIVEESVCILHLSQYIFYQVESWFYFLFIKSMYTRWVFIRLTSWWAAVVSVPWANLYTKNRKINIFCVEQTILNNGLKWIWKGRKFNKEALHMSITYLNHRYLNNC